MKGKPAKYSKYVLDGPKENYNEKLLTLPQKDVPFLRRCIRRTSEVSKSTCHQVRVNENSSTGVNLARQPQKSRTVITTFSKTLGRKR